MEFMTTKHIEYIESKEFLKVLDNVLCEFWSEYALKKRKMFFFFGAIPNTTKWYLAVDPKEPKNMHKTIVYQRRLDDSMQGIPLRHFARALEYTMVQRFDDIPNNKEDLMKFILEYLEYKHYENTTLPEIDKIRGFSCKPLLKAGSVF